MNVLQNSIQKLDHLVNYFKPYGFILILFDNIDMNKTVQQEVTEEIETDFLVKLARQKLQEALEEHLELASNDEINQWRKATLIKESNQLVSKRGHQLEKRLRVIQRAWIRLFPEESIRLTEWTK